MLVILWPRHLSDIVPWIFLTSAIFGPTAAYSGMGNQSEFSHPRGPKGHLSPALPTQVFSGATSSTTFTTFITMFSSYLRASLVALVASAVAVSAAPGLIVKKSSPEIEVDGSLDKRALGSIVKKSSPEVEVDGSLDKRAAFPAAPGLIAKRSSPEVEVDGNLDKRATYDYTKSDYFTAIGLYISQLQGYHPVTNRSLDQIPTYPERP